MFSFGYKADNGHNVFALSNFTVHSHAQLWRRILRT